MRRLVLPMVFLLRFVVPAIAQDRDYGRSMIVTDRGIVATGTNFAASGPGSAEPEIDAGAVAAWCPNTECFVIHP
jgi:hypothetical protein